MPSWRSALGRRPVVSVAMATYDGERFLPQMLASLAGQTRPPDELVVRDDASSDGTLGILHAFARRVPFRVEVIAGEERLGYAQNFVTATRSCTGGVICFADQDDVWRPGKIDAVVRAADPRQSQAIFHDFAVVSDDGGELMPSFYAEIGRRGFTPAASVNGFSMSVTRAFVDRWDWPSRDNSVSHDVWVALLATAYGERRYLDDVLVDYRLHDGNASAWMPTPEVRVFTGPEGASDVDTLIDLFIKKRTTGRWTRAFLDVLAARGETVDAAVTRDLAERLRVNRRRHREAKAARDSTREVAEPQT